MNDTDLFDLEPPKRRAAQCPACGRFAPVIGVINDASPMSAEEGYVLEIRCPEHGDRIS